MAAEYLFSKDVGVYTNMGTEAVPDWKLVTCTTSKGLDLAIETIEKNNDCTGDFVSNLPSSVSWSIPIEGDANRNPAVGEISADELFTIASNREMRFWKLESGDSTYIRYGKAFISAYSEVLTTPEYLTFSATLTGDVEIFDSIPS